MPKREKKRELDKDYKPSNNQKHDQDYLHVRTRGARKRQVQDAVERTLDAGLATIILKNLGVQPVSENMGQDGRLHFMQKVYLKHLEIARAGQLLARTCKVFMALIYAPSSSPSLVSNVFGDWGLFPMSWIASSCSAIHNMTIDEFANGFQVDNLNNLFRCSVKMRLEQNEQMLVSDLAALDSQYVFYEIDNTFDSYRSAADRYGGMSEANFDIFKRRLCLLFRRRCLNVHILLSAVYLSAFVMFGLHLRSEEDQSLLISHLRALIFRLNAITQHHDEYRKMFMDIVREIKGNATKIIKDNSHCKTFIAPYRDLLDVFLNLPFRYGILSGGPFSMINGFFSSYRGYYSWDGRVLVNGKREQFHSFQNIVERSQEQHGVKTIYVHGVDLLHHGIKHLRSRTSQSKDDTWELTVQRAWRFGTFRARQQKNPAMLGNETIYCGHFNGEDVYQRWLQHNVSV